jgi:hypothetical protein
MNQQAAAIIIAGALIAAAIALRQVRRPGATRSTCDRIGKNSRRAIA